ncbi:hypothetical protein AGABI1DRAFT_117874 [Agaricus bisporus var. burnettii JB137-S8]|uniref:DUF7598 domain-containing protein n=1 Tax=Agaricus bisporus var. burnettii (strain JB137-S8 / ATCC MYA-4627 / FGSC 10392) TaxID=597362 RepID=K5XG28_AGABU|nr:uncharacterized protein AGABI1DRAFT_117874 [Agaricus bisporus var. burnettii JB137-S8]EKM82378.1 hypothetical protein AGABI1DRAFT_117874 [Agaricus bisporus var. burnettii JB137-S8]
MLFNARTITFIGLNAIRILSLISLILVFASTIFVMVYNVKAMNYFEANKGLHVDLRDCDYIENSTIPNQPAGAFWAIISSLLIMCQAIILFLSELSWPIKFFDRYFPVLGSEFGLGALGIFQTLIATQILSHFVDDFTLVSAFFLFSIGCVNIFLGLIFRASAKPKRSISQWRTKSQNILPPVYSPPTFSVRNTVLRDSMYKSPGLPDEQFGYGFSTRGEEKAKLRGFILRKPDEALSKGSVPQSSAPPSRRSSTRSASDIDAPRTRFAGVQYSTSHSRPSSQNDGSETPRPIKTSSGNPIPF